MTDYASAAPALEVSLCPHCNSASFVNFKELEEHILEEHGAVEYYACPLCTEALSDEDFLPAHLLHHENSPKVVFEKKERYLGLVCSECGLYARISAEGTEEEWTAFTRLMSKHSPENLVPVVVYSMKPLKEVTQLHHEIFPVSEDDMRTSEEHCPHCQIELLSRLEMKKHLLDGGCMPSSRLALITRKKECTGVLHVDLRDFLAGEERKAKMKQKRAEVRILPVLGPLDRKGVKLPTPSVYKDDGEINSLEERFGKMSTDWSIEDRRNKFDSPLEIPIFLRVDETRIEYTPNGLTTSLHSCASCRSILVGERCASLHDCCHGLKPELTRIFTPPQDSTRARIHCPECDSHSSCSVLGLQVHLTFEHNMDFIVEESDEKEDGECSEEEGRQHSGSLKSETEAPMESSLAKENMKPMVVKFTLNLQPNKDSHSASTSRVASIADSADTGDEERLVIDESEPMKTDDVAEDVANGDDNMEEAPNGGMSVSALDAPDDRPGWSNDQVVGYSDALNICDTELIIIALKSCHSESLPVQKIYNYIQHFFPERISRTKSWKNAISYALSMTGNIGAHKKEGHKYVHFVTPELNEKINEELSEGQCLLLAIRSARSSLKKILQHADAIVQYSKDASAPYYIRMNERHIKQDDAVFDDPPTAVRYCEVLNISDIDLILLAIKSCQSESLRVNKIYNYIQNFFPERMCRTKGWKNSIRNLLSAKGDVIGSLKKGHRSVYIIVPKLNDKINNALSNGHCLLLAIRYARCGKTDDLHDAINKYSRDELAPYYLRMNEGQIKQADSVFDGTPTSEQEPSSSISMASEDSFAPSSDAESRTENTTVNDASASTAEDSEEEERLVIDESEPMQTDDVAATEPAPVSGDENMDETPNGGDEGMTATVMNDPDDQPGSSNAQVVRYCEVLHITDAELILLAIKSCHSESLPSKKINHYVQHFFPERMCRNKDWRNSMRTALSMNGDLGKRKEGHSPHQYFIIPELNDKINKELSKHQCLFLAVRNARGKGIIVDLNSPVRSALSRPRVDQRQRLHDLIMKYSKRESAPYYIRMNKRHIKQDDDVFDYPPTNEAQHHSMMAVADIISDVPKPSTSIPSSSAPRASASAPSAATMDNASSINEASNGSGSHAEVAEAVFTYDNQVPIDNVPLEEYYFRGPSSSYLPAQAFFHLCRLCMSVMPADRAAYRRHMARHSDEEKGMKSCEKCSLLVRETDEEEHLAQKANARSICTVCVKAFPDDIRYYCHLKQHHLVDLIRYCARCNIATKSAERMKTHIQSNECANIDLPTFASPLPGIIAESKLSFEEGLEPNGDFNMHALTQDQENAREFCKSDCTKRSLVQPTSHEVGGQSKNWRASCPYDFFLIPYHQYSSEGHDQMPFCKLRKPSDADLKAYGKLRKAVEKKGQVGVKGIDCIAAYFGLRRTVRESSAVSTSRANVTPAAPAAVLAAAAATTSHLIAPPPQPHVPPPATAQAVPTTTATPQRVDQPPTADAAAESPAAPAATSLKRPGSPATAELPAKQAKLQNDKEKAERRKRAENTVQSNVEMRIQRLFTENFCKRGTPLAYSDEQRRATRLAIDCQGAVYTKCLFCHSMRGAYKPPENKRLEWITSYVNSSPGIAYVNNYIGKKHDKSKVCARHFDLSEITDECRIVDGALPKWLSRECLVCKQDIYIVGHEMPIFYEEQLRALASVSSCKRTPEEMRAACNEAIQYACPVDVLMATELFPDTLSTEARAAIETAKAKFTERARRRAAAPTATAAAPPVQAAIAAATSAATAAATARTPTPADASSDESERQLLRTLAATQRHAVFEPPTLAPAQRQQSPDDHFAIPATPLMRELDRELPTPRRAAAVEEIRNNLFADYAGAAAAAATAAHAVSPAAVSTPPPRLKPQSQQQQQHLPTASVTPMPHLQPQQPQRQQPQPQPQGLTSPTQFIHNIQHIQPQQQQSVIVQQPPQHQQQTRQPVFQQQMPQQMPPCTQPLPKWTHTPQLMQQHPQQPPQQPQQLLVGAFHPEESVRYALKQMHQQQGNGTNAAQLQQQQQQMMFMQQNPQAAMQQMPGPSNGRPMMIPTGQHMQQFPQQMSMQPNANQAQQPFPFLQQMQQQQPGTSRSTQQNPFGVSMQQVAAPGNGTKVELTIEQMKDYLRRQGALFYNGAVPPGYIPKINALTDPETIAHFASACQHSQRLQQQRQMRQARAAPQQPPAAAAAAAQAVPTLAAMLTDDAAAPAHDPGDAPGPSTAPAKWKPASARTGFRCKLCVPSDKLAGTARVQFDNAEEALDELRIPQGTLRRHVLRSFWTEDEADPSVFVCKEHVEPGANAMKTGTACSDAEHCGQWYLDDDKKMHENHQNKEMRFCCRECFIPLNFSELSVIKHMRNKHGFVIPTAMRIACPLKGDNRQPCYHVLTSIDNYREHLQHEHAQYLRFACYAEGFPNHICGLQFMTYDAKMLHGAQVDAEKRPNANLTSESVCCPLCGSCNLWEAEIEGQVVSHFTLHALEWTTMCRFDYNEVRRGPDAFHHYLDDHYANRLVEQKPAGCKACPALPPDQREPINTKAHADSHLIVGLSVEKEKTGVIHSWDTCRALLGLGRL